MLGDHGALITVQGDAGVVEGLLGVLEDVVELGDAALEHRAEVAGDQRPADGCGGGGDRKKVNSFHTQAAKTVLMERPRRGLHRCCSHGRFYDIRRKSHQRAQPSLRRAF